MRIGSLVLFYLAAGLILTPLLAFAQQDPGETAAQAEAANSFRAFLSADWKQWMQEYPEAATEYGYPGQNRRWTDYSPAGIEAHRKHLLEALATLEKFHREALPASEQLDYDLYLGLLKTSEEGLQFGDDPIPFRNVVPHNLWMPINQMEGIQQGAASTIASMPHQTVADYEDILARLAALPVSVRQNIVLLKAGIQRGYSPPKITLRDVPKQIAGLIPADPMKSPLLEPFTAFPSDFPAEQRAPLIEKAQKLYVSGVAPAFQELHDYLVSSYIPACRESIAASALPNGAAYYAYLVHWQTTTDFTPGQIHEIGLREVKRIRAEMDSVIASTGFHGSFQDFTNFLRTDPRFFFTKKEDLVNAYKVIAKSIDPQLVHLFGMLPRNQYGVIPIPDFKAPSQTTAYYQPGAFSAGRPGYFFVNTYKLSARPKWEMEALTLHEAVPGHHLQISLAQELPNVPEFRRHVGYSAYVEGWALYSEGLGSELGLYTDPYSKFGELTYDMWRAVRLVVDTGMHSMGWSRDQAIQYFKENTGKTDQDITVEIDRYIVWPGQALAYKLGQMEILQLRAEAEKRLGSKFDIRKFHDAILENGALPLNVLGPRTENWISQQAKAKSGSQ
jgi:uncharacterized protein (DUF885 family)